MDYAKHYDRLIQRAIDRKLTGYVERHHIIPRCMGGTDDPANIARLTGEEHYVAHQLLVKMYPDNRKLLWALSAMTGSSRQMRRPKNKRYGWLRRRFSKMVAERNRTTPVSAEARARMSLARRGKKRQPHTEETKAKMSAAARGRKKSPEHVEKIRATKLGKKIGPQSADHRRKIAESNRRAARFRDYGTYHTPEYRARQSAKMRLVWEERKRRSQET